MTAAPSREASQASLARDLLAALRYYLRGWRGLVALAVSALIAGVAFNWSWLVAVGIAPLLLIALPCVAMCALGLCMNRMAGNSCSTEEALQEQSPPVSPGAEPSLSARQVEPEAPETDNSPAPDLQSKATNERSNTHG